jgi:sterol desaturase/sphingolipid hydroxylase (fatty acid hydroxylase superfamily)
MPTRNMTALTSWLVLPAIFGLFYALKVLTEGHAIDRWLPDWYQWSAIVTMIALERIYRYRKAVSQRALRARDIVATIVNIYATGFLAGFVFLPILRFVPEHVWGRKALFASSADLGPVLLQVLAIMLLVSFFRYWMHRAQHKYEFLWELHSYHHRVSDLQALNTFVSHPIDFALRNILIFLILGVIGFSQVAILIAVPASQVSGLFSHCGADLKMGFLNYFFVTPEVHRWHHTAEVPQGHRYSVNYGVEFSFWDVLFGTYYLPQEGGERMQPARIGHPAGLPDEGNYVKLFFAPLGLYRPLRRLFGMPDEAQPAE